MTDNETEHRKNGEEPKIGWRAEPRSAIPTAMSRGTVAIAALAVTVLSGQTLGYVLIKESIPEAIKLIAAIFMWALLLLAGVMAGAAYLMGRAVLIRNTAQAMADDRYTKRLEERLDTSEERQKKIMEDFEQVRKERDATATENITLKGEREDLARQLKGSQEESAGRSKEIGKMNEDIATRDSRIQELESAELTLTNTVADKDAEIKALNEKIANRNEGISNRDSRIQELESAEVELKSAEETLTNTVAGKDAKIKTLNEQIANQDEVIATRNSRIQELESKEATLKSAEETLTNAVAGKDAEIKKLNGQIASLNEIIATRDSRIQELEGAGEG